jgi:hypothetical protein
MYAMGLHDLIDNKKRVVGFRSLSIHNAPSAVSLFVSDRTRHLGVIEPERGQPVAGVPRSLIVRGETGPARADRVKFVFAGQLLRHARA